MYIYVMKIVIKPYKTDEFESELYAISQNVRKAKGCLVYSVYRDTEKEDTYSVVGEWQTRQAREKHFKSHDYEVLIGAARVLGETFEMNFAEVTKSGSLELAREQIASQ
jgi:quinol monooxygenase YgiN